MFDGDEARIEELKNFIKSDNKDDPSVIDFNKILPMPGSLDIPHGSLTTTAINAYISVINPENKDFPTYSKVSREELSRIMNMIKKYDKFVAHEYAADRSLSKLEDDVSNAHSSGIKTLSDLINKGRQYVHNLDTYGALTWYDWRIKNWDTKWNAYDTGTTDKNVDIPIEIDEDNVLHTVLFREGTIMFDTAWGTPYNVIKELSKLYPDIAIHLAYADEDIGSNVGYIKFSNGEKVFESIPEDGSQIASTMAIIIKTS
jgi:hypothetical protein